MFSGEWSLMTMVRVTGFSTSPMARGLLGSVDWEVPAEPEVLGGVVEGVVGASFWGRQPDRERVIVNASAADRMRFFIFFPPSFWLGLFFHSALHDPAGIVLQDEGVHAEDRQNDHDDGCGFQRAHVDAGEVDIA